MYPEESNEFVDADIACDASGADLGFPKAERLCGKTNIGQLIDHGKWGSTEHLRFCWMRGSCPDSSKTPERQANRILISVSKRYFKRAVKRNLLKRRLREAYRLNKEKLAACGICFMISYASKEVLDFRTIEAEVRLVLSKISKTAAR